MKLGLHQYQTQRLELKQTQKLEMKQSLQQTMSLGMYQKLEDPMIGLVRYANEHNSRRKFEKNGFSFRYGAVPYEIAKPIAKECGVGFCRCFCDNHKYIYNGEKGVISKGERMIFLVEDKIPKEFVDFVAIHERGEELSLANHFYASKLEFGYAKQMKKIKEYTKWINDIYPSKFVDLQEKVLFPVIPEELMNHLIEHGYDPKKQLELEIANEIIENNPMTSDIMKKMKQYERETNNFCNTIKNCIPKVQKELMEILSENMVSEEKTKKVAEYIDKEFGGTLDKIQIRSFAALSKSRIKESLKIFENVALQDVRKHIKSKITLEENIFRMIQRAKIGSSIVKIEYTPEELARMNKKI